MNRPWAVLAAMIVFSRALAPAAEPAPVATHAPDAAARTAEVLAKLKATAPTDTPARAALLLELYDLKDDSDFLRQGIPQDMESTGTLPPATAEALVEKRVEAAHRTKSYKDVTAGGARFEQWFPKSARLAEVREYNMNALHQLGIKMAREAAQQGAWEAVSDAPSAPDSPEAAGGGGPDAKQIQRAADGRKLLVAFTGLARAKGPQPSYAVIKNQNLFEQLFLARIALGDEKAIAADLPLLTEAQRLKVEFLRTQAVQWLKPGKEDEIVAVLEDYVTRHMDLRDVNKALLDLAAVRERRGERLFRAGDTKAAHTEFERVRELMDSVEPDDGVGVHETDIWDAKNDIFWGYSLEGNFDAIIKIARQESASQPKGSLLWMDGKMSEGNALIQKGDARAAVAPLDEALATGLTRDHAHDDAWVFCAKWRIRAAAELGDEETPAKIRKAFTKGACDPRTYAKNASYFGAQP